MSVGILITNGGTHPPEKWAAITANDICNLIQIEDTAPASATIDKEELRVRLLRLLFDLHGNVQGAERDALAYDIGRLSNKIDPTPHLEYAVSCVSDAAKGTLFEDHFKKPTTQVWLHNVIGQHFADEMHIERLHFADKNPDHEESVAYKAAYYGGSQ